MWDLKLSRRRFLALSGITLGTQLIGGGWAQTSANPVMRIGAVLPAETGIDAGGAFSDVRVGETALLGALMGREDEGARAELPGNSLELLIASAPDGESALRAAERLASAEEVFAIIGGIGMEQAIALSQVAEELKLPFFNIGASNDTLRGGSCNRYTFHVESSAAMYIDSLVTWLINAGFRRWFFVQADTAEHESHYHRAMRAMKMREVKMHEVSRVVVGPTQLTFLDAFKDVRRAKADLVVLLLDATPQLVFQGQYGATGLGAAVTGFPVAATQTRDFYAALHDTAPKAGAGYRITLWEPTLKAHGAQELNERFLGRWGKPMDGPAWAAYESIKMLHEASLSAGTQEAAKIIDYLEDPKTTFDVHKGLGVSFRPWDHQLRQPLYLVRINGSAERSWNLATLVDELPAPRLPSTDPVERLDQIGDLEGVPRCRF